MHLKKGGGESLYCWHSCYDGFRDVVYADITSFNEKKLYIFLATQSSSQHNIFAAVCRGVYCPFIFSSMSRREKGATAARPRVVLSTNAHTPKSTQAMKISAGTTQKIRYY